MNTPRAAPIRTPSPSAAVEAWTEAEHSPTLNVHQPSPTPISPDDAEPAAFDLPTTVAISSPTTLAEEFLRLSLLLMGTAAHWQARVHSLQCLSELSRREEWVRFDNFVPLLDRFRAILVSQLIDRRSAVVKQACATLTQLSTALSTLLMPKDGQGDVPVSVTEQQRVWLSLTCQWFEHLLPNIPVTIKVISEATIAAFHAVISNIAALPPPPVVLSTESETLPATAQFDYSLLYTVVAGCLHRHASAREHCYRALTTLLAHIPISRLSHERAIDAAEASSIHQSLANYKAITAELTEPSSPLPFSPAVQPAGSALFHALEVCLYRGCGDSDAKVRTAARGALMEFGERGSEERGERVLMSMALSGQKLFEREKQDRLLGGVDAAGGGAKGKKMSVRERMKAQAAEQKKKGEVVAKTITHSPRSPRTKKSTSGASSPGRATHSIDFSMGRGDGAFLTGMVEEEDALVGQGVMAEPQPDTASAPPAAELKVKEEEKKVVEKAEDAEANRNVALLTKLLDLESPILTERMQGLLTGSALEQLIAFVVRLPANWEQLQVQPPHILPPSSPSAFPMSSPSPLQRRPPPSRDAEVTTHRRSYNVMTLLVQPRPSPSFVSILTSKLPVLLPRLFSAFLPQSQANLYHTCAILHHLFTLPSKLPLMTLANSPSLSSLFLVLFDHLHEGPVPALILTIFTSGDDKERKKELVASVRKQDILAVLTSRICQPMPPSEDGVGAPAGELGRCLACIDFIQQVVDKVGSAEYLTSLLATIADAQSLIPRLITLITASPSSTHPSAQVCAASSLLLALLSSVDEAQMFIADPSSSPSSASEMSAFARKKIPNPLHALKPKALAVCKARMAELCDALLRDDEGEGEDGQLSGSAVHVFSARRLGLLQVVARVCAMAPECCALISRPVWERVLEWFFAWENHQFLLSSVQSLLLHLLQAAPDSPLQTDTLRLLLVDLKLITRLIAAYHRSGANDSGGDVGSNVSASSSSSALDSTILLVCSHLRLTASLHPPSSFLFSHLSSHSQWRSFQPTLQHETLLQARHQPLPVSDDTLFMRALQAMNGTSTPVLKGGDGIDIGSRFAYSLGYAEDARAIAGVAAGGGRKARKKKNKARQKRAKKLAEAEGDDGGDGEGDDDDGESTDGDGAAQSEEKVQGDKESPRPLIASTQ